MIIKHSYTINGKHEKPILIDTTQMANSADLPIIIFCHGYKGFKDWGAWNLMANAFAKSGFLLVKFNFSHNGGTPEQPIDFPDLEAFGHNNYTIELDDLECVIDWVCNTHTLKQANTNHITLLGHSRGGGIACIKAEEDSRIKCLISLAGVSNFGKRTSTVGDLEQWKTDGVKYVLNGRTKQNMPHYYQFYENFIKNKARLTIKRAVMHLNIPYLIIHGNNDTSVSIEEAKNLHDWNPKSELKIIENANHVCNTSQPWNKNNLSEALAEVVSVSTAFIKSQL